MLKAEALCEAETVDYVQSVQSFAVVICRVQGVVVPSFVPLHWVGLAYLYHLYVHAKPLDFCFVLSATLYRYPCQVPFALCVPEAAGLLSQLRKRCLLFSLPR